MADGSGRAAAREVRAQRLGHDLLLGSPRRAVASVDLERELTVELGRQAHVQLDQRAGGGVCTRSAAGRAPRHMHAVRAPRARHTVGIRHGHGSPRLDQRFVLIVSADAAELADRAQTSPMTS